MSVQPVVRADASSKHKKIRIAMPTILIPFAYVVTR